MELGADEHQGIGVDLHLDWYRLLSVHVESLPPVDKLVRADLVPHLDTQVHPPWCWLAHLDDAEGASPTSTTLSIRLCDRRFRTRQVESLLALCALDGEEVVQRFSLANAVEGVGHSVDELESRLASASARLVLGSTVCGLPPSAI